MEYQPKSNEKYTLCLHCVSSFEGTSYKELYDKSFFIFHRFLELSSILSEKKIFVVNFPFSMNSVKPPPSTPLMAEIGYVWRKFFVEGPFGNYEDFLELSIMQFVIQLSLISLGRIIMCCVKNQKLMLLVAS